MFAIIAQGGKQYLVEKGQRLDIEKIDVAAGKNVTFDRVLLISDGEKVTIGQPTVTGAAVKATVNAQFRDEKVTVLKYKPKVRYRKKYGHRQSMTKVTIDSIAV